MARQYATAEEVSALVDLLDAVHQLMTRLRRLCGKLDTAYFYFNSAVTSAPKIENNSAHLIKARGEQLKTSTATGWVEAIQERILAMRPAPHHNLSPEVFEAFQIDNAARRASILNQCADLIEMLERPSSEREAARSPATPPVAVAVPAPAEQDPYYLSPPIYRASDLAHFEVFVPGENYSREVGQPIIATFRFNMADFTTDDGIECQLCLDSCILQAALAQGDVEVERTREVPDETGQVSLRLKRANAVAIPREPKWRMEAAQRSTPLSGFFENVELCTVKGAIAHDERLSMSAPVSAIKVRIEGVQLEERSKADAVIQQWLKLTVCGRPHVGQYDFGSRSLLGES